jgi:predicted Zn-dependent protease
MQKALLLCVLITGFVFHSSCKNSTPDAEWKKVQLGSMGLSVEAPFEYEKKNIESQLTPSVRKMVNKMETFVNETQGNYYAINIAEYAKDVTFSSSGAMNGALAEMRMKAGGEISNRKDETKQINGNEAITVQATFANSKKEKRELQMAILNKGNTMYQVICLYKDGSEDKRKEAARIIESISIN